MTNELEKIQAVKIGVLGDGRLVYKAPPSPLPEQVQAFKDVGATLVDTLDCVDIRLEGISDSWTRTGLIPLAIKGENTILYRPSEPMNVVTASEFATDHRNGEYSTRSKNFYYFAKETAKFEETKELEDRTFFVVEKKGDHELTPEMPTARFFIGGRIEQYFDEKVNPYNRSSIPFFDLKGESTSHTTVNCGWFVDPRGGSGLYLGCRGLYGRGDALGVAPAGAISGEATQKNLRYNLSDVRTASLGAVAEFLEERGMAGLQKNFDGFEKTILRKLRKQ